MSTFNCPTCREPFDAQQSSHLPFCSKRCQQIDLGRWLNEENALPMIPDPEDDEQPEDDLFS